MVARSFYAIDSEALTVTFSTTQSVGDPVINNSDSPDGTQYVFGTGWSTRQVTVDDTGGSRATLEDDDEINHVITDGAGIVTNGNQVEAESIIELRELDSSGLPTGPIITIVVFSQNGVTSDVWGFASDTPLVPGTEYEKVGGGNIGSANYTDYATSWLVSVDGTSGADSMGSGYTDAEGDIIDGADGNDEFIYGYAGADTINAGAGNDHVDGGADADTFQVTDGFGSDTIIGGETGTDTDSLDFSGLTSAVGVTLTGNEDGTATSGANDITFSEIESFVLSNQNDSFDGSVATTGLDVDAGGGNDRVITGTGDDLVVGGDGNDILLSGAGNDGVSGGSGNDSIDGGAGNDRISGGRGRDTITGGTGADSITGNGGADSISGGDGNDVLAGGGGSDTLEGGANNDTLSGGGGVDDLDGGTGDDSLVGGRGGDALIGGDGNDTIQIAQDDKADGGAGDDYFILSDLGEAGSGAIAIVGGETGETAGDTLQLTPDITVDDITFTNTDDAAGGLSGNFTMADGTVVTFSEIENIICFTPGARILTARGERPVESLKVGDIVVTRDNGLQPIRWIGRRTVAGHGRFAPIRIAADVLEGARSDLLVSPQHRILFNGYHAQLLFGESEVLAAAKHMVDGCDIRMQEQEKVTYIHIMFDRHEIIYAEGIATESFYAGDEGVSALGDKSREELFQIFPELRSTAGRHGETARICLRKHETRLLADRQFRTKPGYAKTA